MLVSSGTILAVVGTITLLHEMHQFHALWNRLRVLRNSMFEEALLAHKIAFRGAPQALHNFWVQSHLHKAVSYA